jgi:5-hydroxyisourate hydrolase-like protein (transthyretin family)
MNKITVSSKAKLEDQKTPMPKPATEHDHKSLNPVHLFSDTIGKYPFEYYSLNYWRSFEMITLNKKFLEELTTTFL